MKKLLSILGVIGLTVTSTTTLISCEKPNNNENGGSNKPEPTPEPQQPPKDSNWKLITDTTGEGNSGKTYIGIFGNKPNVHITSWKGIEGEGLWHLYQYKAIYRWDGVREPQIPAINSNTGEITDWKD
ncbi:lipoprotein [Spiroplasma endosymbiont of Sarcophaga variegata]|uniref:lipoprotein n=1 Tax=Spiroplasma endosymbiont of Sarcophaga variegata TaxID=3066304 RepID=UPI003AF42FBD